MGALVAIGKTAEIVFERIELDATEAGVDELFGELKRELFWR